MSAHVDAEGAAALFATFLERVASSRMTMMLPSGPAPDGGLRDEWQKLLTFCTSLVDHGDDPVAGNPASIGPFRILGELGRGAHARVLLAEDSRIGRKVALKLAASGSAPDTRSHARLVREGALGARTEHPGLLRVLELGDWRGEPFLVLHHVEGRSLASLLADADAGPPRRMLELGIAVATALHALHEAGVVHGDIKPQNIVVDPAGAPVLVDFSVARCIGESADDGGGTLEYSPPEHLRGGSTIGQRAGDVWSLGVTLLEACTGTHPFAGPTQELTCRRILTGDRNPAMATLPADLRLVLATATDPDPHRRYRDAAALAADLRCARDGAPIAARPPGPMLRLRRFARRQRRLLSIAGAAGLSLAVAAITFLVWVDMRRSAADAAARTARDRRDLVERQSHELLRLGDHQRLAALRSRAEDLWPAVPDRVDVMHAWLQQAHELVGRLPEHVRTLLLLRGSPDDPLALDVDQLVRHADELRGACDRARASATPTTPPAPEHLRAVDQAGANLRSIRDRIVVERDWPFPDAVRLWHHRLLQDLVRDLVALTVGPTASPTIGSMHDRVLAALTVAPTTLGSDAARAAWAEAARELAARPVYQSMRLSPQLGLLPIGADPASGLLEFAFLPSGRAPQRAPNGRLLADPASAIVFVLLPGGDIRLGAEPPTDGNATAPHLDPWAEPDEAPVRTVRIAPLFVGKHEITQAQWQRLTGTNPSTFQRSAAPLAPLQTAPTSTRTHEPHAPLHPVENVTHAECRRTLARLGLSLPTEAEWEYAARGGTGTVWWTGDDVLSLSGAENLADRDLAHRFPLFKNEARLSDGFGASAPVGCYRANAFGLHDMLGNVSEWCNPESTGTRAALRGGSWIDLPVVARSAARTTRSSTVFRDRIGVRAVRRLQ